MIEKIRIEEFNNIKVFYKILLKNKLFQRRVSIRAWGNEKKNWLARPMKCEIISLMSLILHNLNSPGKDYYTIKYNSSGTTLWTVQFNGWGITMMMPARLFLTVWEMFV